MVSVSILVVAIVALTGLAYPTVPMSIPQTITNSSTELHVVYVPYAVWQPDATTQETIYYTALSTAYGDWELYCVCDVEYCWPPCAFTAMYTESTFTSSSSTMTYTQTVTSSITESSIGLGPAYSSLGLTGTSFALLSTLVIGILALVTEWFALKAKHVHGSKKATTSQFMKVDATGLSTKTAEGKRFCVNCKNELPPNLRYCDTCGTEQP